MQDHILAAFLERQYEEGMALAKSSDLLRLHALDNSPPQLYVADFHCKGLVRTVKREIVEASNFAVGIWFPSDYLQRVEPFQVLRWLGPTNIFHPNISDKAPIICVGQLSSGTSLVTILYQVFEIITYNKVTMLEGDSLNREACAWARQNLHRFPIDRRRLTRRTLNLQIHPVQPEAQP